ACHGLGGTGVIGKCFGPDALYAWVADRADYIDVKNAARVESIPL
ncbi:32711_t:CDS:1, partial [Gigaspora margarita]